ncbi:MAG TPA: heme NO-binding domain-containing protein [Polyangiaceae bacterium]
MHGLIHLELQKFVESKLGAEAWGTLLKRANLASEVYTPLASYPDEQMLALVREAVGMSGLPPTALLEAFGEFLVPSYLAIYSSFLKSEWRTLDVLEHTEETIHRVVRMRHQGAEPPRLRAERTRPNEVVMTYDSPRRLCAVARGIARGIANKFDETITIEDRSCMHRGDPACILVFRRD